MPWFAVRNIFADHRVTPSLYEERIILLVADDFEHAHQLADAQATLYCEQLGYSDTGHQDAFHLFEPPKSGVEVFSLSRESALGEQEYVAKFFDTGAEIDHDAPS
jgi:hypothetical protein